MLWLGRVCSISWAKVFKRADARRKEFFDENVLMIAAFLLQHLSLEQARSSWDYALCCGDCPSRRAQSYEYPTL